MSSDSESSNIYNESTSTEENIRTIIEVVREGNGNDTGASTIIIEDNSLVEQNNYEGTIVSIKERRRDDGKLLNLCLV